MFFWLKIYSVNILVLPYVTRRSKYNSAAIVALTHISTPCARQARQRFDFKGPPAGRRGDEPWMLTRETQGPNVDSPGMKINAAIYQDGYQKTGTVAGQ